MRRICPNCKEILGEYDYLFCSSCGSKLPDDLQAKPNSLRIKTYSQEDASKKSILSFQKFKSKKLLYGIFLTLFISVLLFGIYSTGVFELLKFTQFNNANKNLSLLEEFFEDKKDEMKVVQINREDIVLDQGQFSKDKFASLFPGSVDFYFESFELKRFSDYFSKESTNENDGLVLSNLFVRSDVLFEKNFAGGYFIEDDSWVFVFELKDKDLTEIILDKVDSKKWEFKVQNNFLIMAQNKDTISLFEDVSSKVKPSLYQNSDYIKRVGLLPLSGSVKAIFINANVKPHIQDIKDLLRDDASSILIKVLNLGYDELVVRQD